MLEGYTSFIENDVLDIQILLAEGAFKEVYQRYAPVLQDMLGVSGEVEWLDFVEQQSGELEEAPLRLHLSAWQKCCLELGGYEKDVTEKLALFLQEELPEKVFSKLECSPVYLDIDEPSHELESQLDPYQEQIKPWGCRIKLFFDDTYCAGVYFLFLEVPKQW